MASSPTFLLHPIGVIRTPYTEKYHAPRQPGAEQESTEGIITLFPGKNLDQALGDLDGFERVWILFWFHKNTGWKPKVLPPRSGRTKRGVFSTRSPHRPNPIGLSLCKLISTKGRTLRIENPDLLDGTPILDIKPYLVYAESFPNSRMGWLEAFAKSAPAFTVTVSDLAQEQAAWLEEKYDIHFIQRIADTLSRDPMPHSFRRIKKLPEGGFVMGAKSWRVFFEVDGSTVRVGRIESGYPPEALARSRKEQTPLHDEKAHRAFQKKWK